MGPFELVAGTSWILCPRLPNIDTSTQVQSMTDKRFVFSCMHSGPSILFPDDEYVCVSCERHKGHTHEHRWFSDDGSVVIRWEDEWSFAEGKWRDLYDGVVVDGND